VDTSWLVVIDDMNVPAPPSLDWLWVHATYA